MELMVTFSHNSKINLFRNKQLKHLKDEWLLFHTKDMIQILVFPELRFSIGLTLTNFHSRKKENIKHDVIFMIYVDFLIFLFFDSGR